MMNLIFIVLFLLAIPFDLFAEDTNHLIDLPPPTPENLRWNMPADAWREAQSYLAKGYYFRISSDVGGKRYLGGVDGIKMYENPEFKGDPYLITYSWIMDKNKNILCDNSSRYKPNYKDGQIFICDNFCREIDKGWKASLINDANYGKEPYTPTYQTELSGTVFGKCKIRLDGFRKIYSIENSPEKDDVSYRLSHSFENMDWGTNFYLKTEDTDFKKGFITIKDKDKKYYLDVRFCLKDPQFCRFVNIEKSEYERDLERLEKIKKEKSHARLNTLIKELKPCVVKKDKDCIKKFFPKPVSKQEALEYGEYPYEELVIDDEFLKELLACLNYESLLPHLLAFRGVNKACIFNSFEIGSNYLLKIDYPEAVRFKSDSPIYLIK